MGNIETAKAVADVVRTCLGPRAMLKMLMDPMGGIVLTNDGHAILREIDVAHPVAKSMLELCRGQDEEVGDGTTSVIILAGEMLMGAAPHLEKGVHPTVIIKAFKQALDDALRVIEEISVPIDVKSDEEMLKLIRSCLGTKMADRWSALLCGIALKAARFVAVDGAAGGVPAEVDIKRYAKVEKIPGGEIEECTVLDGVVFNKDIIHPTMRRRIEAPRIVLLDCPLEYKKGESQMNIEVSKEADWERVLQLEEEQIREMCELLVALKPDVVISEKGISDLAQHYLAKANISAIRRVRKSDNNRLARAVGATIVNRLEDLKEADVGRGAGLFSVEKIGDEYFTYVTGCKDPKACTIVLRGASKDILNELERNLQDALAVARNLFFAPRMCPGGGATEMAIAVRLDQASKAIEGVQKWPYKAVGAAMEVIPRTLVQNCGGDAIRVLTDLRAKHAAGDAGAWGIDGLLGKPVDMRAYGVWEPAVVKSQTVKTAIESACMILRVDDIVSGLRQKGGAGPMPAAAQDQQGAQD